MIQVITKSRYPELYSRMLWSAKETASGPIAFSNYVDEVGNMEIAGIYNVLGSFAKADILIFVHDDIIFLSKGWDDKIKKAMALGFNVVGVIGSKEYRGGMIFDSGREHSAGKVVGQTDGKRLVRLMEHRTEIEPVSVLDGMFLAVNKDHFLKTGFDNRLDGLWFWDLDLCLRSNCAVVDILVAHEKPDNMKGGYPADLRPMSDYEGYFYEKHGIKKNPKIGDQRCDAVEYSDYVKGAACL